MIIIPDEIEKALPRNQLVFFVGSGFSKPLGFLDWRGLALKAVDEYKASFPDISLLKDCLERNLLSEILVFDALKDLNKHKIVEIVKANNNGEIDESKLENHKRLWKISNKIITTNYDKAIETVKPNTSIEVISHDHLFEVGKSLKKDSWLFHIHGMIDNVNECIIFSEDYQRLYFNKKHYTKHPAIEQLKSIALHNTILFLGFSMKDKYVANLFEDLNLIFSDTPSSEHFILLEQEEQLNSKYVKKIPIDSYLKTSEFLDLLIASKEASKQSPIPIKARYLRRRCRTFEQGSNDFNNLMLELRSEEFSKDKIAQYQEKIINLNGYERTLTTAALYENSGQIEKMINLLSDEKFRDNQENTRLLFLAVGFEKLDKINSAIGTIDKITSNPDCDPEISLCAKFNRSICCEKIEKYDEVYFEQLINNKTILKFSKERIKDKAISNHLIVCKKRGLAFNYEVELKESIEYEIVNSGKSQVKTLINYLVYKNEIISNEKYDEIISLGKNMNVYSRVALLCSIYKQLDIDTKILLKEEILSKVTELCSENPSQAKTKYLEDLRKFINGQN